MLRGLVVLVEARDYARVPAEQLLDAVRLAPHQVVAKGADVVDLLFEERARELLVDAAPVMTGAVDACRVPQCRVEDDRAAGRAFDRLGRRLQKAVIWALGALVGARHHDRPAILLSEVV
jgi:hypothetical protein